MAETRDHSGWRSSSHTDSRKNGGKETKFLRPVGGLEIVALALLVVLADLTIYRGAGYAGLMAFVLLAPVLLLAGRKTFPRTLLANFLAFLLVLAGLKLLWSGNGLLALYGLMLLVAFVMEIAGITPYLLDVFAFSLHLIVAGFLRLDEYFESLKRAHWMIPRATLIQYGLPLAAVLGFGVIFVQANPDESQLVWDWLSRLSELLSQSLSRFAPSFTEILFWLAMAWIFAGLFKPVMTRSLLANFENPSRTELVIREANLYPAFANTLIAVIVLFTVYLVFEFQSLWLKDFPPGFYYSGYAHEGAAWLTVALALATVLLSAMFRADILNDPRLPKLKRLAWIWSALNLGLAVAVYHRLLIYVGFNGMTRMRTVGFLGITAVVAGFLLVVKKMTAGRDFVWLIRRQLWVLAFAGFLFAVLPVDSLVHRYNVRRILAGDPAPSVQIMVHPMDSGGVIELFPLLASDDPIIREGVRALLAHRALVLKASLDRREHKGWTSFQWADWTLHKRLEESRDLWSLYNQADLRDEALGKFYRYAYQWY